MNTLQAKRVVEAATVLVRDDQLQMTVAQLIADRFEMADPVNASPAKAAPSTASGLWPTFIVNFGGGTLRAGAFSFSGVGSIAGIPS